MKRAVCILLAAVTALLGIVPLTQAAGGQAARAASDANLIACYLKAVHDKDYTSYLNLLGDEFRGDIEPMLPELIEERAGVGAIQSIDLDSLVIMADLSDTEYSEIGGVDSARRESPGANLRNYLIKCDMKVYQDNEFFFNGINYLSITCGAEGGERKIIDNRLPLPDAVAEYETDRSSALNYFNARFTEERGGFYISDKFSGEFKETASYSGVMPTEIKVYFSRENKIKTIKFKEYCRVVMVCEEGYENRQTDYKKAFAIAIKHFGWFRILKPRPDTKYHVRDDDEDQVYNPSRKPANYPTCDGAMLSTWNTIMVNSGRNLFKPQFRQGDASSITKPTQSKGIMYEYEVWKSLVPSGMSYVSVLKYYYSYAKEISTGAIRVCSNHTGTYTDKTPSTHTVNNCTTCKVKLTENHTFKPQGHNMVCQKCGYSVIASSLPGPAPMRNALNQHQ